MSDIAIRVAGLGKQYRIGRQRERYKALRDVIADAALKPFRVARRLVSRNGRSEEAGEETIWALKDVSFDVKHGEVLGVIGRNGAGKSTLLKILSRITEPTDGRVEIHGRVGSLLEVGTGFHPELTGRENIYLNGSILGMKKAEIERKFDEIVAFSELDKFIDTMVKRYSSGMYLRLAFAVAAHLDPEILLVDEVLAVGDIAFQAKCLGKMDDVAHQGRTVLLVSHNMAAIARLCHRSLLLEQGSLRALGETDSVLQQYMTLSTQQSTAPPAGTAISAPIYINSVTTRDLSGTMSHRFDMQEPVVVEVEYLVTSQCCDASLACVVADLSGNFLIDSHDTDLAPLLHGPRSPGRYRARVTIPGRLLNAGRYEIWAFSGIPRFRETYHCYRNVYIDIDGIEHSALYQREPLRRAALALELEWQSAKVDPEHDRVASAPPPDVGTLCQDS